MFVVSVQSSEPSNSKTVCFSSWIIWNFTKRPCCESSYAPSLSDQNYNCCVTRQRSLCGKLRYRIWHLLVAEGFTSFKARQEWMEWVKTSARYLAKSCPWLLLVLVSISWGSISEDQKLCQFKECMFYFPLKKNGFGTIKGEGVPFPLLLIPASPFPSFPISFRILPRTLIKADTHEGFCSSIMLQVHAPGAKFLRAYQRFHGYTSSSGVAFPPRKKLHDI